MGQTLYFVSDRKKEKQIVDLCRDMGLQPRKIKEPETDRAVGVLAGVIPQTLAPRTGKKAPAGWRMPELLIFCGLEDGILDRFLSEYRSRGIEPVSLKAVATPYNLFWTIYELAEELIRERTAMQMKNHEEDRGR